MAYPRKPKRANSVHDQKNQEPLEIVVSFGPPPDESMPDSPANLSGRPTQKSRSARSRQLIFRFGKRS